MSHVVVVVVENSYNEPPNLRHKEILPSPVADHSSKEPEVGRGPRKNGNLPTLDVSSSVYLDSFYSPFHTIRCRFFHTAPESFSLRSEKEGVGRMYGAQALARRKIEPHSVISEVGSPSSSVLSSNPDAEGVVPLGVDELVREPPAFCDNRNDIEIHHGTPFGGVPGNAFSSWLG